jgi:hypothetical protein
LRIFDQPAGNPDVELLAVFSLETAVNSQNLAMSHFLYTGGIGNLDMNLRVELDVGEGSVDDLLTGAFTIWLRESLLP